MAPQPPPAEPTEPGEIVRALRRHTRLTQEKAAAKSEELSANEFARIETGWNQCTSGRMRIGLARAFDLKVQTMADLLDRKIGLAEALRRIGETNKPGAAAQCLGDRPEWKSTPLVEEARALYKQIYGPSRPEVWARLADVLDSGPFPRPLTPAFLVHVAHALAVSEPELDPNAALAPTGATDRRSPANS